MRISNSLYDVVIDITRDYLGPSSQRVIDRQIQHLLGKNPTDLNHKDMPVLIDWAKVAFSVLTEDPRTINEYVDRLQKATARQKRGAKERARN